MYKVNSKRLVFFWSESQNAQLPIY